MKDHEDLSLGRIRPYSAALLEVSKVMDAALIVLCLWLSALSFGVPWSGLLTNVAWIAGVLFAVIGTFNDVYRSWRSESLFVEIRQIVFCSCLTAVGVGFALYMLSGEGRLPHEMTLTWLVSSAFAMSLSRLFLRNLLRVARLKGHNYRRTAIVGSTPIAQRLAHSIEQAPWMGLRFVGLYDDRKPADEGAPEPAASLQAPRGGQGSPGAALRFPERRVAAASEAEIRGTLDDLVKHAEEGDIDRVYITLPLRAELRIKEIIDRLSELPVTVLYVPDFFVFNMLHAQWEQVGGQLVVNAITTPAVGVGGVAKRAADVVLSSIILVLLAVPLLVIALAVKLTSPGPAIFKQRRYGLNGREFEMWKFRTMTVMENGTDFVQARRGDARVTKLGAFLRRTSLDELPQFLNVLRGDMSIVGPRPHPTALDDQHRSLIPRYYFRHKIKPGITGLAQVSGYRGPTDTLDKMEGRVKHDIEYIDGWSLMKDFKIIWLTVWRGLRDKNAL